MQPKRPSTAARPTQNDTLPPPLHLDPHDSAFPIIAQGRIRPGSKVAHADNGDGNPPLQEQDATQPVIPSRNDDIPAFPTFRDEDLSGKVTPLPERSKRITVTDMMRSDGAACGDSKEPSTPRTSRYPVLNTETLLNASVSAASATPSLPRFGGANRFGDHVGDDRSMPAAAGDNRGPSLTLPVIVPHAHPAALVSRGGAISPSTAPTTVNIEGMAGTPARALRYRVASGAVVDLLDPTCPKPQTPPTENTGGGRGGSFFRR